MERGGTQGIQFIVQLVLARLLLPEDYGVIALITIFLAVANTIVQSGFGTALIQKKTVDNLDFSSVFYLNLLVSLIMYIIIYFFAPTIALFYDELLLIKVLRVLAFTLFFGAINSVQIAIVSRSMQFKRFFFSSLGGILASGLIGIILAYLGFGAWALVWQQLINNIVITVILWFTVKWRPDFVFSVKRIKLLFQFGWKLLCSALIDTIYTNIYSLVIGKIYNPTLLGYYTRGEQFPKLIVTNINSSVSSVLLPAMSAHQNDIQRVKSMTRKSIKIGSSIVFPLMIGLAVCAEPLIVLILTEKWLPAVPFLQIMCITYAFWPIHTANLQAINAIGRSDIFLKLEIVKKVIAILILLLSIPMGIYVMVLLQPVNSLIATFINSYPNKRILKYSFTDQMKDILPSLLLSIVMGAVIYPLIYLELNIVLLLILQCTVGMFVYLSGAILLKMELVQEITTLKKSMFKKRNGKV